MNGSRLKFRRLTTMRILEGLKSGITNVQSCQQHCFQEKRIRYHCSFVLNYSNIIKCHWCTVADSYSQHWVLCNILSPFCLHKVKIFHQDQKKKKKTNAIHLFFVSIFTLKRAVVDNDDVFALVFPILSKMNFDKHYTFIYTLHFRLFTDRNLPFF